MTFARTKIQAPKPRTAFVERGTLQERLAAALVSQRLVLLAAPAGYGKTTALAHELARLPPDHAVAWISADAGDDLQRLLDCLVAALEPIDPPWRTAPEALAARAGRAADEQRALVAELINTLDGCEVAHGVIVFDDAHRVDDPAFFALLDLLLERLSGRWTVALTARSDPPLALARLRARGELAEFRQLQLQFARDEARRLARDAGLDGAVADRLFERTGGWPAGLRIAISAAQGAPGGRPLDPQQWQRAVDRPLFDYLVSEVLGQLRPELREFLLRTSVLADLDPARCEQVAGQGGAAALLDEIESVGLCTAVVDAPSPTLRLHDLLRDAMQNRLRIERPDVWRGCLQRAAEGETDPVRRQVLWLTAGRYDEAVQALQETAPMLNLGGTAPTLLRLAAAFPPAFAAASPELQRVLGQAKQTMWHLSDAERHYERAGALYRARGDAAGAKLAAVRRAAVLASLGRLSQATELLDSAPAAPTDDFETRMIAATAQLWLALERGEFDRVAPCFDALLQLQLTTDRLEYWQTIPSPRVTAARGAAPLVARWAGEAMRVAGDRPVPLRALAQIALGWRALWLARFDEAAELLARAEADAQWLGENVIARSFGLALHAVLALVRGDRATALETMRRRVAEQPAGYGDWGLWQPLFAAVRVAAACADAATTREWLAKLLAMHPTLPEATERRLLPARGLQGTLAFLEGRRDEAIAHWQAALAEEDACDLMGQANELRIRLAAARLRDGKLDEAAGWIAPCLERTGDGPRGAVFAAEALVELACADWGGRLTPAAKATLTVWAAALADAAGTPSPSARVDGAAERLTARELEVLARITAGDSNKLIARAFDLSLHTVKRHVANILGKLGVGSRGQAAAWYRANEK